MFSRLVKETLDLMTTLSQDTVASPQQGAVSEGILPALSIAQEECQSIQNSVMSNLEKTWAWLAGVLDVVEGQLRMGKNFDTKVASSISIISIAFYTNCLNSSCSINHANHCTKLIILTDVNLCNINAVIKKVESFCCFSAVPCLTPAP